MKGMNMNTSYKWILALLIVASGLSCESTEDKQQAVMQKTRQQALGKVREIHYRRAGGGSSNRESLSIMTDGQATTSSTLFGDGKKTLTEFQMLQFSQWFENFEKWNSNYAGKSTDAMVEIQYGDKAIRIAESAKDVPEELLSLQNQLRELIRDVAGK
jgi:hypothetical protein